MHLLTDPASSRGTATTATGRRTREATLANGLRVVAERVPGTTGCAVTAQYRAGFRDEPRGRAGFAHLFEHLMFQGSRNVERGQHFAELLGAGGTVNGNTFTDVADYHQTAPLPALGRILELEADRMADLDLTQRNLDVQRRVVVEEINLQLRGRAYGGFPWTVLPAATYHHWANTHNGFGTSRELHEATLEECAAFYERYYAPGNAAVGVVADVDPDELLALARTHLEPVPAREVPDPAPAEEPSTPDRTVALHVDRLAPRPAFALGWRLPDPATELPAYAAAEVLSRLLTQGSGARLRVVMRELGAQVDTSIGLFGPLMARDPDTFVLVAHHRDGGYAEARDAVLGELAAVAASVAEEQVRTAVLTTLGEHFQRLDSPAYRVRLLARGRLLFGRTDLAERYVEQLRVVTADDVREAAGRLLATTRGTVLLRGGVS